jgi:hypothetical protein
MGGEVKKNKGKTKNENQNKTKSNSFFPAGAKRGTGVSGTPDRGGLDV